MSTEYNRRDFIKMISTATAATMLPGCGNLQNNVKANSNETTTNSSSNNKPNIVFILADDLGYGDVSCLNPECKIKTPNIDKLASQGKSFTDSHTSCAVCTPTRYSILTGRYNWRSRLKWGVLFGYSKPLIEKDRPTVASYLQDNGYTTACIGKWHLGLLWEPKNGHKPPYTTSDRYQGIDYVGNEGDWVDFSKPFMQGPTTKGFDYFFGVSGSMDMPPYVYLENDRAVTVPTKKRVYWWRHNGHAAQDFDVKNVMGDLTRKATHWIEQNNQKPFFLYFPLTAPHVPIAPSDAFKGKSKVSAYYDFVLEIDSTVGQIMKTLDKCGVADNTLLIFTSDNGPDGGEGGTAYPLRGKKRHNWDGGHRTPYIVRWPGKIKPGSTSSQLISTNDLFATCSHIIGKPVSPPDSMNILPSYLATNDEKPVRQAAVHTSSRGLFAIRKGKWKLLTHQGSGQNSKPVQDTDKPPMQLYDMSKDISELNNLYNKHPEKVKELLDLLEKYKSQGHSQPLGSCDFL